jgi:hypothetical protein
MKTLSQTIIGSNELKKRVKTELESLLPYLEKFMGKKIFLKDGSRAKGFDPSYIGYEYDKKQGIGQHRCHLHTSRYGGNDVVLDYSISLSVGQHTVEYFDLGIYLGKVDNDGKLIEVKTLDSLVNGWELDVVLDLQKCEDAIKRIHELEGQIRIIKEMSNLPNGFLDINIH